MNSALILWQILAIVVTAYGATTGKDDQTEQAKKFLEKFDKEAILRSNKVVLAMWEYNTNITDGNLNKTNVADADYSVFQLQQAAEAKKFDLNKISDQSVVRQLVKIKTVGIELNESDALQLSRLTGNMSGAYSTASICSIDLETQVQNCSKQWVLEPDLIDILVHNRNYDSLKYIWKQWRDVAGRPIKSTYKEFVELSNKGAKAGGFSDTGAFWRWPYEDENFEKTVENLWYELLPLYEQLHTYVRRRLHVFYTDRFSTSAMPAHILGNMWGQSWENILNITLPYPNKEFVDVSEQMKKQNFTPLKMFKLSDEFFQSIGMIPMTPLFWNLSMFVKPNDRQVVCHASAWDFYINGDTRIKMCTKVDQDYLITVHHEMGHIQYYLQYAHQPAMFREGANPGFHEAIGDTMALSVSTPTHLATIGLLPDYVPDKENGINQLYRMSLDKVAFLPFGYMVDKWRWNVFNGNYKYEEWNDKWVTLRKRYQGLVPPVPRTSSDFDPGAKYHIPANSAYMSYFVSYVLQFQFYRSMCEVAGHKGPLYLCDFYRNLTAGELFANMMKMGSSKPWPEALKLMVGSEKMSASGILEYFQPLYEWLKKNNFGECFGWNEQWPEEVMKTLPKPRCNDTINKHNVFEF